MEELEAVRVKWKNGKSCGPDMVSHEAPKAIQPRPIWGNRLLELFNDMFYTCRIHENVEAGATILLAKVPQPLTWGETRPITLSSVLLKSFGQLLLQRAGDAVQTPAKLQWCRRGRQGIELIMILRRLARLAHDWGLELYIAKLDIRKAFDSIFQESLADHVCRRVGEDAHKPWEARAWVSLLRAPQILIHDLAAAISVAGVAKPRTGNPPPADGGSYMDDNFIWSIDRKRFQRMLDELSERLPKRGLHLHPGKTDIIQNGGNPVKFVVAGETVLTNGPKHIFHVLGSPLSFQGGTPMLVAEMQSRARKAFWSHREAFTSPGEPQG
ncbi:unnamed protein product [Symbiodinium sp. CCMP2456]|nr:unnamed protein product [Symbiodinium sp. CCMP2456]